MGSCRVYPQPFLMWTMAPICGVCWLMLRSFMVATLVCCGRDSCGAPRLERFEKHPSLFGSRVHERRADHMQFVGGHIVPVTRHEAATRIGLNARPVTHEPLVVRSWLRHASTVIARVFDVPCATRPRV